MKSTSGSLIRRGSLAFGLLAVSALVCSAQNPPVSPGTTTTPAVANKTKSGEKPWSEDTFQILGGVRSLPDAVKKQFPQSEMQVDFSMADPGQPFQSTDIVLNPNLPWRRLVYAGLSQDYCFIYYERGGLTHTFQVVVFRLSDKEPRFVGGLRAMPYAPWKTLQEWVKGKPLATENTYF